MKTLFAIVLTLGLIAASAFAQPTVTLIYNAASASYPPLQNSSIGQGSYFTIYGNNFGPASSVCSATPASCYWNPYPLPTSIGQTSVNVTVGGTTVPVYLEFAEQLSGYSQINAVLPSNTPVGTGTLTVTENGSASNAFAITVAASSFGTFAWNEAGSGPGIFTNAVSNALITPFAAVKPGDYVTIWGTGLGPVADASAEKAAAPPQTNLCATAASCPVTVWIAGQQASVTYAGRSPYTAEDQIDFIVPSSILSGCYVQVAVQTGSVISNFTSLAVDPGGAACSDGDGINYSDLAATVASNGQANVGDMILLSNYLNLNTILGAFQWDNDTVSAEIGTFSTRALESFEGVSLAPSVGNCTVSPFLQYPPGADPGLALVSFLDAGSSLSITGPNGTASVPTNKDGNGYYNLVGGETIAELINGCPSTSTNKCAPFFLTPSDVIDAGTYTVSGPGGAGVGAFSAPIVVSQAAASFKWTNQSSVTASAIDRSSPLTITWTGGDPSGYVDITAVGSTLQSGTPAANTPGVLVECIAAAQTQSFTIPAYVLQALPSTVNSNALVPPGELLVGPASGGIPVANPPSGLDALYLTYHFIQGQNVSWQ